LRFLPKAKKLPISMGALPPKPPPLRRAKPVFASSLALRALLRLVTRFRAHAALDFLLTAKNARMG